MNIHSLEKYIRIEAWTYKVTHNRLRSRLTAKLYQNDFVSNSNKYKLLTDEADIQQDDWQLNCLPHSIQLPRFLPASTTKIITSHRPYLGDENKHT